MGRITEAIKHLLIINILFFLATWLYGDQMYQWFSLWYPENANFRWWQIVSHMFMHGGLMHLVFNMYALWAFGSPLEQRWGRNKFLFFYFSCGLGAALVHTGVNYYYVEQGLSALANAGVDQEGAMELLRRGEYMKEWFTMAPGNTVQNMLEAFNTPAVGASGAIYGVLVAFGMSYPNSELFLIFLPIPIKAKYFIPAIILMDLLSGVTGYSIFGQGIAHFAHVGGALFGYLMMTYWKKKEFDNKRWDS